MGWLSDIGNAIGDAAGFVYDTTVGPIVDFVQSDVGEAIYSQIPGGEYVGAAADILQPSGADQYVQVGWEGGGTSGGVQVGQRPNAVSSKWLWIIGILAAVALFWKSNPGWKILGYTVRVGKKKPKRVTIGKTKSGNVRAVRVSSKREQQLRNLAKGRKKLAAMRKAGKDPRKGKKKTKRKGR